MTKLTKPLQVMIVVHVVVGLGSVALTLYTVPLTLRILLAVGWVIAGAFFVRSMRRLNDKLLEAADGALQAFRDVAAPQSKTAPLDGSDFQNFPKERVEIEVDVEDIRSGRILPVAGPETAEPKAKDPS